MKISSIIGIIAIAIAIGVIVSTTGDASTYVCFKEAEEMAIAGDEDKIHVVGSLKKDAAGIIEMNYKPEKDPNYFTFTLVDDSMQSKQVVYYNPKPQDFERSEKIVVIGAMKGNVFVADKILMKCPSKYQDNEFREVTNPNKPANV